MYSLQECIKKLKEIHSDLYPVWYIEHDGVYLFNLLKRGINKENAIVNFYAIRISDGIISGPLSPLDIYSNPKIENKLDHPHFVDPEDQKPLSHGVVYPSTNSLCHHGIKGQKWGIRRFQNLDGTLTEEGKERYRSSKESQQQLANLAKDSMYRRKDNSTRLDEKELARVNAVAEKIKSHPAIKDVAKRTQSEYKKCEDVGDQYYKALDTFYSNKKLYEKYLNMAVDSFMNENGQYWNNDRNAVYEWFKYDDGDQGDRSSLSLYMKSSEGKDFARKLNQIRDDEQKAYNHYQDVCKKYISEYTGEYGNEKFNPGTIFERTVNSYLASFVENIHRKSLKHSDPDFLIHYGIKGQKWGVHRFQNEDGTLTPEGKERYYKGDSNFENGQEKKPGFAEKYRINQAKLADKVTADLNTPLDDIVDRDKSKKKQVSTETIAFDVALTLLNPFNVTNLLADGMGEIAAKVKTNSYFKKRPEKSDLDPETGLYIKKEGSYTEKQDIAAVNPGYMDLTVNTKNNCMLCTTTYDMRKRGYDVTSQLDSEGYSFPDLKKWYPKAEIKTNTRYDDNGKVLKQKDYVQKTVDSLVKQGNGARGNIMLWFFGGGGHSIAYEIKDGKLMFIDGQTGRIYKQGGSALTNLATPERFLNKTLVNSYARLDNVDPDMEKIIKECVR